MSIKNNHLTISYLVFLNSSRKDQNNSMTKKLGGLTCHRSSFILYHSTVLYYISTVANNIFVLYHIYYTAWIKYCLDIQYNHSIILDCDWRLELERLKKYCKNSSDSELWQSNQKKLRLSCFSKSSINLSFLP